MTTKFEHFDFLLFSDNFNIFLLGSRKNETIESDLVHIISRHLYQSIRIEFIANLMIII